LPPEVDVPLPLVDDLDPALGLGSAEGFAELAAGSPLIAPRPLGVPWAKANELLRRMVKAIVVRFMVFLLKRINQWTAHRFQAACQRASDADLLLGAQRSVSHTIRP
jgi:hypothetical protein